MKIENSQPTDIARIFELYKIATEYMKSKGQVYWPSFQKELIENEIEEKRQWKLSIDGEIACIWATTLHDELIWAGHTQEPSVYIHRIATNPEFRGQNLVQKLVTWANAYGLSQNLLYIRLDTVGLNKGLINHYQKHGFDFLGAKALKDTTGLPDHYQEGEVCYFQKAIL